MKLNFKKIIFSLCTTLIMPTFVSADVGLLVGRNYGSGDINTTTDITKAQTQFTYAGQGYISNTNPTYFWITGEQNGVKRVENSILFFSGHGNQNLMHFYNNDATAGGYDFYITGTSNYGSTTVRLASYDMSKVKLAVFAGCKTGSGTSNVASQTKADGAKATIGWKESIQVGSHSDWLNRFWSKVFTPGFGGTMLTAIQYANSFTYSDSRVKNISTYGNWSTAYNSLSLENEAFMDNSVNINNNLIDDERKHNLNIVSKSLSEEEKINVLDEYIKNNIDSSFKIENFDIKKTEGHDYNIYDITYVINGDIKSILGYTVFEIAGKFVALYDNTQGTSFNNLETLNTISPTQFNTTSNISISDLIDTNTYTVENDYRYKFYDNEDGRVYYVIRLDLLNKIDNTATVKTFKYEL